MEHMLKHSGEGTTVSNASLQSQTSSTEQQSVGSALEYEVFLSFRGPDVRKSFADCLYSYLVRSKIRTFRDEEELRKGETIAPSLVQAITESKIYIPIFSKSYASSKWCLQELAKMVECSKKEKGHIILPVFYFVDPRDVRHQAGPYEEAFEQHNKKHDPVIVQEWRIALQEVGQMKGWHVTEIDGQGAVIDQIFSKVELHLRSNYTLVTEELVGVDFHVQEVVRLLNLDSGDGKIVGIHGISGVGKTTIAKAVYDNICTKFDRCCFLENIGEMLSKNDGIVAIQTKVIRSIMRDDVKVKDASQGTNLIRERVCKYKILIVLDDVDDRFEFGQILGKLGHFSLESRFIITTRDKRVLELVQEYKLYEPKEMSYDHSLQLFSKHAFHMNYPPEDYGPLCDEFIKVAAKLPLALKVIGSLLFCRDEQFWEEMLTKLKEIPSTSNKVQERLKISYNELTCSEKKIFLDIACFFIGEDKDSPVHLWSDCKLYPESGIRTLVLRSFIKIDERNQFWMHDLIRDLGRAIVMEEDVKNPCKRSRIWSYEDAMNMFKNAEGTDQVEMLRIDLRHGSDLELTEKTFEKLAGLKYLDIAYSTLTGDFSGILPNIRWLRLHDCRSVPTDLNLKKVVILDLLYLSVTDDWRGWSRIQVAHKLKVINIRGCHKLNKVPNLAQCESLELIDLTHCYEMRGELHIESFRNLKVVRLIGTTITDLPGDMGKLQKLQEIITGMFAWRAQEIVLPRSLKRLIISCPKILNLLELKNLEDLCFMDCDTALEISGDIWQLTKLKTLKLCSCRCNGSLLDLNRLPNLGNLNNLVELQLINIGVTEIHGLGELRLLEALQISNSALDNLNGLENLVHLRELTLDNCGRLEDLPNLSNLIKLHSLVIIQCTLLSKIQGLGELRRSLLNLELSGCVSLANIEGTESLEALESLTLELEELWIVHAHADIREMVMEEDDVIPQKFRQHQSPLKQFPDLSHLQNLKKLSVMGWRQLPEVTGIEKLISLKSLVLTACKSLRSLPDLSDLKNLEKLDVKGCVRLIDVTGLERLESLQRLTFSNCWSLEEFPDMSGLKNLEGLDVSECIELIKVTGLGKLEKLQELRIVDCKLIKELPDLSGLKNLEVLNLKGCKNLRKVKGLEELDHLFDVNMDKRLLAKYLLKVAVWAGRELTRSAIRRTLRSRW
ncbi:Disease resistance protein L6 [Linum perenne]